ncbi:hypothetical protein ASE86_08590 [Sphingomonas sp. Leaf33]|uniref:DUF6628 family protein n=1 Tax=Sphingomonas sp. Leaf33 TaxID=1736215 RepID=UPI0006FC9DA8|nr:DUF6628 family protein [Sphingomonas sp. Leaf33]KQN26194.1 hypothetical protein ASE86_08590 [Sphingomonas sp. Leaf33]
MTTTHAFTILPQRQPDDAAPRLLLFAFRQMGAHGLEDAAAVHAFVTAFGKDFRRPLVLLRTLMVELSQAAQRPLQIAPWCCGRMTGCEGAVLAILSKALTNDAAAELLLADLLGTRAAAGPLATATALAVAFADLGMPLG